MREIESAARLIRRRRTRLLAHVAAAIAAAAVLGAQERGTAGAAIDEIRRLGLAESSQVMDHAFFLSDVAGPRLTGSPAFRQAGEWALARLRGFGLDVDREPFVYGRSWSERRFTIRLLEPRAATLIGTAVPWSASTAGEVAGEPVIAPLLPTDITKQTYDEYVGKFKGKLRGRFVLLSPSREVPLPAQPSATRITDEELDRLSKAPGATDNAAGCAIAIEAMRILASLRERPARTIRLALWGGHEGAGPGPGGSLSYVRRHFGSARTPTAEHRQLRLYLNLDNGGGRIRGVYLPARYAELTDRLQAWFAPLRDLGATTVVPIGVPGGSDHVAFHDANIPAAMFAQDPLDYRSLTRHSNQDLYDRLRKDDMRQAATVTAAVLWQAAAQSGR